MPLDKTAKPITVGFIFNQFEGAYQSLVWRLLYGICRNRGIRLMLFPGKPLLSPYEFEVQHNAIFPLAKSQKVDGILTLAGVLNTFTVTENVARLLTRYDPKPVVCVAVEIPGYPAVLINSKPGLKEAISHLKNTHNCRRIAFVKGLLEHIEVKARFHAFEECMDELGLKIYPDLIVQGNLIRDSGYKAAKTLFQGCIDKPDAIIFANDDMLIGAVKAFDEMNVSIPTDVKLIGFDDIEEVRYISPPATTIRQPLKKQLETALDMLLKMIHHEDVTETVVLPSELVIRQSCGCLDELVTAAAFDNNLCIGDRAGCPVSQEEILTKLALEFKLSPDNPNEKAILELAKQFILYLTDFKEMDVFSFMNLMEKAHTLIGKFGTSERVWHKIMITVRNTLQENIQDEATIKIIEERFLQAIIQYGEIIRRTMNHKSLEKEWQDLTLQTVSQSLITSFEMEELTKTLETNVVKLDVNFLVLYLYESQVIWDGKLDWKLPEKTKMIFSYHKNKTRSMEKTIQDTMDLLPTHFLMDNANTACAFMPLFFREEQFGYMAIEVRSQNEIIYETLRGLISSALKGALLLERETETSRQLKTALNEIEKSYQKMEHLSTMDELTGLYNRRGFMSLAHQHFELSRRKHREFLFFFIDLDGLKHINDNFGHKEGDFAIRKTAEILTKVFRQTDILGRMGGDEFTVVAIDSTVNEFESIQNRINHYLTLLNLKSGKPYKVGFTIGLAPFEVGKHYTLDELMAEADRNLYKLKKEKHKNQQ